MRTHRSFLSSRRRAAAAVGLALLLAPLFAPRAAEARVNLRLATVAPRGSAWHLILDKMAADIGRDTGGEVRIRIIAGGAAGDETAMISKMRIGQVQMAAVSNIGLAELDPKAWTLSIPMVFRDYLEWDHVREAVNPSIEEALRDHGFRAIAWADVGWLHFFASEPVNTLDDLKGLKLAGASNDQTVLDLLRWSGFDPVQINSVELVSGFQTGLIEAAPLPIVLAEGSQIYRSAKFMNSLPWAPMQGAIIVHDDGWDRLDAEQQEVVLNRSHEAALDFRESNRQQEQKSLAAMKARGLEVIEASGAFESAWMETAETLFPLVREQLVSPPVFDRVIRLRDEYRAANE